MRYATLNVWPSKREHRLLRVAAFIFAAGTLIACGETNKSPSTIEPSLEQAKTVENKPAETISTPATTQTASTEDALLKRGRIVWFKCRSCHELGVDGPNKVGPNLYGLMGANAGEKEGFVYSDALRESGIVWTDETLDAFIEKPASYIKGTKMAFVGIKKDSDRQAVIAYIKANTKPVE